MTAGQLRDLPNIGPAMERALHRLDVYAPAELRSADPGELWHRLGELEGRLPDPCVLDTFAAVIDHLNGAPARPWWDYSRRRKAAATLRAPEGSTAPPAS